MTICKKETRHQKEVYAKISLRKEEHIKICLEKGISFKKSNGFDKYDFKHQALPEINYYDIDITTTFLNKKFKLPFYIEALTGGSPETLQINRNLARAAEKLEIGMGLGSQRAMIEDPGLNYTYWVRNEAPNIFLLGNIGAVQLKTIQYEKIESIIRDINADGLAIHLNAAHELCQNEGDIDWSNIISNIERICTDAVFPVVVKETGCGISGEIAKILESAGASSIDIAGAGGTCMARVEHYRKSNSAKAFFEWGIPTAESLIQCKKNVKIPLIASGGIRTGVECAKALNMGASLIGFGLPLLKPATHSHLAVIRTIDRIAQELKMAMMLVGAQTIKDLKNASLVSSD